MSTKYILVDCDFDKKDANEESTWDSVDACKADIIDGIVSETDEPTYLPWRILIYDPNGEPRDMNVHSKITNIITTVQLEIFGGGE